MRERLRNRDSRLLLAGQSLSMFGDWTLLLVFAIWAKTLTGSSALAGLTIFAVAAPALLTPLGAVIVDRVSRRRLVVAVSLFSALVVSTLWFVRGPGQLWLLFTVAVYYGLTSVIINAAVSALTQEMLPLGQVEAANGVLATMRQGLRLIAPLIGAGLYTAVGGGWVATLDAITFLTSGLALFLVRFREDTRPGQAAGLRAEIAAGASHIRRDGALLRTAVAMAVAFGALGLTESAVFALVDEGLHKPPAFVGFLTSAQGVGAIAAGSLVTVLITRIRLQLVLLSGLVLLTMGIALAILPVLAGVLIGFGLIGGALPVLSVGLTTLVQHRTPNRLTGRVAVAFEVITSAPTTLMIALSAVMVNLMPYQALFSLAALGIAIGTALFLSVARTSEPGPVVAAPRVLAAHTTCSGCLPYALSRRTGSPTKTSARGDSGRHRSTERRHHPHSGRNLTMARYAALIHTPTRGTPPTRPPKT